MDVICRESRRFPGLDGEGDRKRKKKKKEKKKAAYPPGGGGIPNVGKELHGDNAKSASPHLHSLPSRELRGFMDVSVGVKISIRCVAIVSGELNGGNPGTARGSLRKSSHLGPGDRRLAASLGIGNRISTKFGSYEMMRFSVRPYGVSGYPSVRTPMNKQLDARRRPTRGP
ncbi:hypothetical protein VUR80DRAFT_269 [Thermomyces stellatus]